jgi:hypothetical protein
LGGLVTALAGGIEPPAPQPLDPIEVPLYSGVINEIYFSTLIPGWTTAHGGSLVLRAVFEEEGTELQGTLLAFGVDVDLSHLEIDVFLLPRLDSHQTLTWSLEVDVVIDGGFASDLLREQVRQEIVASSLVGSLVDSLAGLLTQLNGLLDLEEPGTIVTSITIEDGEARFERTTGAGLDVVFDAVEVADDTDGSGKGELSFRATVSGGLESEWSEPVTTGSGTVVPLEGAQWRVGVGVGASQSLSVSFEARDQDGADVESLGVINLDLDPGDAPRAFALPAPGGAYTLLMRLEPVGVVGQPPGTRHLRVELSSVSVLHDHDAVGAGDVQVWGLFGGQPTAVSAVTRAGGAPNDAFVPKTSAGDLLVAEFYHPENADLELRVVGWDVDANDRGWLGEGRIVLPAAMTQLPTVWPLVSDTGDFVASVVVTPIVVAPEDGGEDGGDDGGEPVPTVRRTVVFETVTIEHTHDTVGPGDIVARAVVNGHSLGGGDPVPTGSGTALPLVGSSWRTDVDVVVDGLLEISVSVVDVDGRVDDDRQHNDDEFGSAAVAFNADQDYGVGAHSVGDSDGDFRFTYRVLDPDDVTAPVQATVRFQEVQVVRDHDTLGRGAFWAVGAVRGLPVGDATRFVAGAGEA